MFYAAGTSTTCLLIFCHRSGTSLSPAADVWQHLQLQKKVETNEGGVSKVISIFKSCLNVCLNILASLVNLFSGFVINWWFAKRDEWITTKPEPYAEEHGKNECQNG